MSSKCCPVPGGRLPIKAWTDPAGIEPDAVGQLRNIANLPWVVRHVAVMPDVHKGYGSTIGSVFAMRDAVSPGAVGVDIGCGMGARMTNLRAEDVMDILPQIYAAVAKAIPVNHNAHEGLAFESVSANLKREAAEHMKRFKDLQADVGFREGRAASQIGTLGGGNHFVELCLDTEGRVWVMLHSGSRNIGKELADHHVAIAKKLAHNAELPDPDLAVFLAGTKEMKAYRHDLFWAQNYARINRLVMMELYENVLRKLVPHVQFGEPILCHHNYVAEEWHFGEELLITRKGAISARQGQMGIIPGSMGAKSFIVRGLGHPDSFCSASHGAGRVMSRAEAKRRFSAEDVARQTEGVYCLKDSSVRDEAPAAYKDIEEVMRNQAELVEIVHELKQVLCLKGGEKDHGKKHAA